MGGFDWTILFWVFIFFTSVLPALQKSRLNASRMAAFRRLEQDRKSRVIGLIHRQETMNLLGFPVARYIDIQDSEDILRAIELTDPGRPIDLILHTPGGLVLASEQIATALHRHPGKVTVFVPHYAMSGGTLLALAADEIVMAPNAVLGPVDPQLGEYPAASILRVMETKPISDIDDKTIILADMAQKAIRQVGAFVNEILVDEMPPEKAAEITRVLTTGVWTHDYPIKAEDARKMGLPVSTELPREVMELMQLYPQSAQRRPSVEYIPIPYGAPERLPRRTPTRNDD